MKKNKKHIGKALLEGLLEIVFTFFCLGVGAFIISLFGVSLDLPNIDWDLVVLLGLIICIVIVEVKYK